MTIRAFIGGVAGAAVAALSISSATAADLPRPAPAPTAPVAYAPAAIYNWSGFYIGAHAGGDFGNSSWSDPFTGASNTFSSTGFLGGAQLGANYQLNMLVLGVEGDFSWTNLKGSGTDSLGRFDQYRRELDVDRHRPRRRRVRSLSDLRKGRCRVCAGREQLHRHLCQQREHHFHAHRLDRRRRT